MTFIVGHTPWNKDIPHTTEVKNKISQSMRGKPAWNKNKHWSDEVKQKISQTKKSHKIETIEPALD